MSAPSPDTESARLGAGAAKGSSGSADATPRDAPGSGNGFWQRTGTFLDSLRKAFINAAALFATAFVLWVVVEEMATGDYEVTTIDVSPHLAQDLPGEAVSAALGDRITDDWRKASQSSPIRLIKQDNEEPTITIGGSNLSIRYVAKMLRRQFHRPITEIGGGMVEVKAPGSGDALKGAAQPASGAGEVKSVVPLTVRLTLRNSAVPQSAFFDEEGPFDTVIQDAALASLGQIDPFAAVLAGSQGTLDQRQQALRVARTTLAKERDGPQAGKSLLAEATAYVGLGRWEQAETDLNRAVAELQRPGADRTLLPFAHDGLATVYIVNRDWSKADEQASESLRGKEGKYDSAEYHRIEIKDEISRAFFGIGYDGTSDPCPAERSFQEAARAYHAFVTDHPGFSVAYSNDATMRLIRLHWLRVGNVMPDCEGVPPREPLVTDQKSTEQALEQSVTEDPQNSTAWFQYANFLFEAQDPQYIESELDPAARLFRVEDAERAYQKSLTLNPSDYYIWFRYAETLLRETELRPTRADTNRKLAIAAYCSSVAANRRDSGLVEAARRKIQQLDGTCPD